MSTCRAEMETGLNDFIAEQASLPGEAALMLADFDHEYVIQWPMQALSRPVPRYSLQPRGKTALFDAIGSYIGDINEVLSHETVHRPVVVCIVTDGHENGSREWDRSTVKAWIRISRTSTAGRSSSWAPTSTPSTRPTGSASRCSTR